MAKCGITNIGGGGGIGSDELTVTKDYVLSGLEYVGADTDDEKGVGIMINNGTTANQNLNASGSFLVKGGYHAQPFTVNANSLASQTSGTAISSKMLNGETAWVNGSKITGAIVSMGGQTINPTASQQTVSSSGKYMTGNVVVNGVSNLTAANIKKGANVGGTVGTFEGYVPTATDLYLRGNNIAGFGSLYTAKFDAGQITIPATTPMRDQLSVWLAMTGFNYINIEGVNTYPTGASGNATIRLSYIDGSGNPIVIGNVTSIAMRAFTISFDIRAFQFTAEIRISIGTFTGAIYRIWRS